MCGIIGYVGNRKASTILLKGLKNLEYRGYDSAGIAIKHTTGHTQVKKSAGKLEEIERHLNFESIQGNTGIAHTRWATHGAVTDENAHPHTDCEGKIAIVHNGIIENYRALKERLISKGHSFTSDTDSEVIAHLIEENLSYGFEDACMKAFSSLEGSYAILALKADEDKIVGARKDSPLVLGIAEHGIFLASDIPSFLEWTNKAMYLNNYDFIIAENGGVKVYNDGIEVLRQIDTVGWNIEEAKKGEFKHFMMKEMSEQAETVMRALLQDENTARDIVDEINNALGVFFVGCGSSYHACLAGSYLFSKIAKVHVNPVLASEFENYEHFLTDRTLAFAVSQSGETADVLFAVRAAKSKGSKVIGITNVMGSSLTMEGHALIMMNSGPEICVLSTKTYTSQVVLMTLFAYAVAGKYEEGLKKIGSLYLDIYNLTSRTMRDSLTELAEILRDKWDIYLIGRGLQYTTALEAALKIKEVSYLHAEAFAGGELKHGPLALIEDGTPCIVFVSAENRSKILSNAEEVKSRGGYIIGVSSERDDLFDFWIKVPEAEELNPILQIIPMQVLAYELAVLRGLDPDKPRNLAKSVTVI
ncbi:MAG TPA: glutamine--fructose-6-phosphate transaminase (isomerizing) [Candidatus Bathyarchaeia archaeon]|nr:glutamine--fructose-6-phosphate transaminase (isomerizing) [Candidatus Bathyarchaeia archaeon]